MTSGGGYTGRPSWQVEEELAERTSWPFFQTQLQHQILHVNLFSSQFSNLPPFIDNNHINNRIY